MIEIQMSRDIKEFEPKVIGYFTARQLKCSGVGLLIGLPAAVLTPGGLGIKLIVGMLLAMPVIACGWVDLFGMPLHVYLRHILFNCILTPQNRRFESENEFHALYMAMPNGEAEGVTRKTGGRTKNTGRKTSKKETSLGDKTGLDDLNNK